MISTIAALCTITLLGVLRLVTHPSVFHRAARIEGELMKRLPETHA